jgi:hypothetical protein
LNCQIAGASRTSVSLEEAHAVAVRHFAPDEGLVVAVGEATKFRPVLERLGPTTVWAA